MTVEKRTAAAREIRLDDPSATAPSLPADSALDRYRRISRGLMASDAANNPSLPREIREDF